MLVTYGLSRVRHSIRQKQTEPPQDVRREEANVLKLTELITRAPWREAVTYRKPGPMNASSARKTGSGNCWKQSASDSAPERA